MKISDYQKIIIRNCRYESKYSMIYPVVGITSAIGEIAQVLRDRFESKNNTSIHYDDARRIYPCIGFLMRNIALLANEIGLDLEEICEDNARDVLYMSDREKIDMIRAMQCEEEIKNMPLKDLKLESKKEITF